MLLWLFIRDQQITNILWAFYIKLAAIWATQLIQERVTMNFVISTQIFYLSLSLIYFPPSKHNAEIKIYSIALTEIITEIIVDLYAVVKK